MKHIGKYKIPQYAICAIEYGDFSGLDEEDIDNINEFLEDEFPNGFVADWHINEPDGEPYFTRYPAFGMPTEVVDADFYEP